MPESHSRILSPLARRSLLKQIAVLSSLSVLSLEGGRILAASKAPVSPPSKTPKRKSGEGLSLAAFLQISQFLTARESLSPEIGQQILASLNSEPKHRQQLPALHRAVQDWLRSAEGSSTREFLVSHNQLADTAREILLAWFTGVRVQAGRPHLFTYIEAQMWNSVQGLRNIPATCGGVTNFWSEAPQLPPAP